MQQSGRVMSTTRCAIVLLITLAAPAAADDGLISENPIGAALAISIEPAAIGYCRDHDAGRAMACALDECRADGGESCRVVEWCAVAGTAGIMFGYNTEIGMSALFPACGGFSREGIEAVLKAKCETDAQHSDCSMVVYWDHEGVDCPAGD
jgi:hypothetical protein